MKNQFKLSIDDSIIFYSGQGMKTEEHANPTVTIIIAQNENFEIVSGRKTTTSNFSILPANFKHTFSANKETTVAMFFIEQFSKSFNDIKHSFKLSNNAVNLDKNKYPINEALLFNADTIEVNRKSLNKIFSLKESKDCLDQIDERITHSIKLIDENTTGILTPKQLSEQVFISESRLRYLFKKEMGVSISKFIRWKKLRASGAKIMNGMNFKEACYSSGFYDAAHFNRVCKEMIGVNPSDVLK